MNFQKQSCICIHTYNIHYSPSRKQAAMHVHKEFAARTYSHPMYALTALVKNLVKKTRANGFESVFCKKCTTNYYGSGMEMMRAQVLGKF